LSEIFLDNIYLVLLLPLWIFLIIMLGRFFSVYVNNKIICLLTLLSSAFGFILSTGALIKLPYDKILETQIPIIKINDFIINAGLHVDRTALIFALVLYAISFCVQLFSVSYLKDEKKFYRFFALLNFFNFSMSALLFSPNLYQTYFFWELVGICSYLLIGFEYSKDKISVASKKVFIINRFGDTALIGAIILSSYFIYTYAPNKALTSLSFTDLNTVSTLVYAYATSPIYEIICSLFLISIFVKSAQFPFYTWLQDAMQAKLPVSALLHSATLVASGLFLGLRILPFLTLDTYFLKIISIIGILTTLICSLSACSQTNPKKTLAYSTSAQLGLMFFALGNLNIKAVIAFFVTHALIKSSLFMTLPSENEKWNYTKSILFLINGLSLSGLIFSGMIAKEMITAEISDFYLGIFAISSFLTAFYIFRIALYIQKSHGIDKKYPDLKEILAIFILLGLNILFYIYLYNNIPYQISAPFWVALSAWICVCILYLKNAFRKIPLIYQLTFEGFYLDKFYTTFCVKIYELTAKFFTLIEERIFANYKPLIFISNCGVKTSNFIENNIMNGSVKLITNLTKKISEFDIKAQSGNIQTYNAYAFIIITAILIGLIYGYSAIITNLMR